MGLRYLKASYEIDVFNDKVQIFENRRSRSLILFLLLRPIPNDMR